MNIVQAMDRITYYTDRRFPKEEFAYISSHKEEALPYFHDALKKALAEKKKLPGNYQLHFYGIFFLAEFEDTESFPDILKLACLPSSTLDALIGDAMTENLRDILYNTYNGDCASLKKAILRKSLDEFVRHGLLDVMGQLYLDGRLDEKEWKDFLKEVCDFVIDNDKDAAGLAYSITICHFFDMLPEIKRLLDEGVLDPYVMGNYDSCVDYMFSYRDKEFCKKSMSVINTLKHWTIFDREDEPMDRKEQERLLEKMLLELDKPSTVVSRKSPCPCGSGKKYKNCCMIKQKSELDRIEDLFSRKAALKDYPVLEDKKEAGHIYLSDYFDQDSIEIDQILYLGLKNRPGVLWERDYKAEEKRTLSYLELAFVKFEEKVKKEGIKTLNEYDSKFSIHYFCDEWLGKLLVLSNNEKYKELYRKVKKCIKNMSSDSL